MSNQSRVVVTCASGKQNTHLIPHLYSNPSFKLRLAVNSSSSYDKLSEKYPKAEVVQVDLSEPSAVRSLVSGATHVYHVGPSFHPHEMEIGYNMIDAAVAESKKSGSTFKHFVLSSVLNSQLRKLLNHDCKRYVEEYLMESGLNWTILQPAHFVDNTPLKKLAEQDEPVYPAAWDPKLAYSFLVLRDLGEAGAKVLSEGGKHYMAQYPLSSTMPMSYIDLMATLSKVVGKNIRIERKSYEEAVKMFCERILGGNVSQGSLDGIQRMMLYYDNRALQGNPNVLGWLLGRAPTSIERWAQIMLHGEEGQ